VSVVVELAWLVSALQRTNDIPRAVHGLGCMHHVRAHTLVDPIHHACVRVFALVMQGVLEIITMDIRPSASTSRHLVPYWSFNKARR